MDFNGNCMTCAPTQIISLKMAVNDISSITVKDQCGNIYNNLTYSYSVDGICWSCYMSADDVTLATLNIISDYFVRIKVSGQVSEILINDEPTYDYTTSLDSTFNLEASLGSLYSPYDGIESATQLQEQLSDIVANMIGLPIYYFRIAGIDGAADLTFKEYALKSVIDVKQIQLVVGDGNMPSSRPEFSELGLDWQTDWETEISKNQFATAFGNNVQPMEGDLVYIPLMKRMWRVSSAYDERNGALMWQSTTFKLNLVKYQIDGSLDLAGQESFIDSIVKNKYEDLFGTEEGLDSGVYSTDLTRARPSNLYAVYKSDATRKEMTCDTINFQTTKLYHKGTLISDNCYKFSDMIGYYDSQIIYQRPYCGDSLSMSFIILCNSVMQPPYKKDIISIGNIKVQLTNNGQSSNIKLNIKPELNVDIDNEKYYLITLRYDKILNTADITASEYKYPSTIPLYKLSSHHYFFDVDNKIQKVGRWSSEMNLETNSEVSVYGFPGTITNFKLFDVYNDKLSELLQQYPTHQHLQINDTARPIVGLTGTTPK